MPRHPRGGPFLPERKLAAQRKPRRKRVETMACRMSKETFCSSPTILSSRSPDSDHRPPTDALATAPPLGFAAPTRLAVFQTALIESALIEHLSSRRESNHTIEAGLVRAAFPSRRGPARPPPNRIRPTASPGNHKAGASSLRSTAAFDRSTFHPNSRKRFIAKTGKDFMRRPGQSRRMTNHHVTRGSPSHPNAADSL